MGKPKSTNKRSRKGAAASAVDIPKPKRPLSAYFIFLKQNREQLKASCPNLKITDLAKKAGANWKALSEAEKAKFQKKAETGKRRYKQKMETYRKRLSKNAKPKRPMTAFFLWLNKTRGELSQENPELSIFELAKVAGGRWRDLDEHQKGPYMRKAAKAMANYSKDLELFNKKMEKKARQGSRSASVGKKKGKKPPASSSNKKKPKAGVKRRARSNSAKADKKRPKKNPPAASKKRKPKAPATKRKSRAPASQKKRKPKPPASDKRRKPKPPARSSQRKTRASTRGKR